MMMITIKVLIVPAAAGAKTTIIIIIMMMMTMLLLLMMTVILIIIELCFTSVYTISNFRVLCWIEVWVFSFLVLQGCTTWDSN